MPEKKEEEALQTTLQLFDKTPERKLELSDFSLQGKTEEIVDPSSVASELFDDIPEKEIEIENLYLQGKTEETMEQLPRWKQTDIVQFLKHQTENLFEETHEREELADVCLQGKAEDDLEQPSQSKQSTTIILNQGQLAALKLPIVEVKPFIADSPSVPCLITDLKPETQFFESSSYPPIDLYKQSNLQDIHLMDVIESPKPNPNFRSPIAPKQWPQTKHSYTKSSTDINPTPVTTQPIFKSPFTTPPWPPNTPNNLTTTSTFRIKPTHERLPMDFSSIYGQENLQSKFELCGIPVNGYILEAKNALKGIVIPLVKLIGGSGSEKAEVATSIMYNVSMSHENHSSIVAVGVVLALKQIILPIRSQWNHVLGCGKIVTTEPECLEAWLNNIGCWGLIARYVDWGYSLCCGVGVFVVNVLNVIMDAYSESLPVNCSVGRPNKIHPSTICLPSFSQELRNFQTAKCFQVVVNNLEYTHERVDIAISTALTDSRPVYLRISCNLAVILCRTFSHNPVLISLSPRLSNKYIVFTDAIHNGKGKFWTAKVLYEELIEAIERANVSKLRMKNNRPQIAKACCKFRAVISKTSVPTSRNFIHGYKKLQAIARVLMLPHAKGSVVDGHSIIKLPPKSKCWMKAGLSTEERVFYTQLEAESCSKLKAYVAAGTASQNYANILQMLLQPCGDCDHPLLVKGSNFDSFANVPSEMTMRLLDEAMTELLNCLTTSSPNGEILVREDGIKRVYDEFDLVWLKQGMVQLCIVPYGGPSVGTLATTLTTSAMYLISVVVFGAVAFRDKFTVVDFQGREKEAILVEVHIALVLIVAAMHNHGKFQLMWQVQFTAFIHSWGQECFQGGGIVTYAHGVKKGI